MDSKGFRQRNEDLSRRFDLEDYLQRSHFLVRFIALARIKRLKRLVGFNAGNFLDVGCGNAFLLERLGLDKAFGMDLSFNNITNAKKRLNNNSYLLVQADAEIIPFGSSKLDTVVCSEVIEHVQEPELLLKEISRVLKPQGSFILTIPNDNLINRCKKILGALKLNRIISTEYGGAEEWHIHIFTKKSIKDLLAKYGFIAKRAWSLPCFFFPIHYIFYCKKGN